MFKQASDIFESWLNPPYGRYKPLSNYIASKDSKSIAFSVLKINHKSKELLIKYINTIYKNNNLIIVDDIFMFICDGALPDVMRKDNGQTKKLIINGILKNDKILAFRCEGYYSSESKPFIIFQTDTGKLKELPKNVIYKNIENIEIYGNVLEIEKIKVS